MNENCAICGKPLKPTYIRLDEEAIKKAHITCYIKKYVEPVLSVQREGTP